MSLDLEPVYELLKAAPFEWAVAGGWAVDLFAGRRTRGHGDVDIAVWRGDQEKVRAHLQDGEWFYVANGRMHPWNEGERLELPVHEIHFLSEHTYEFLLNETVADAWQYRRDPKITRALEQAVLTRGSVRLLAPEIVLLYKSKEPRDIDEDDFETLRVLMSEEQKEWLRRSLDACYPGGHRWHGRL